MWIKNKKKLKLYRNINYGTVGLAAISSYGTVSLLVNDNILLAGITAGVAIGSLMASYVAKNESNKIFYNDDSNYNYTKEEKDKDLVLKK